MAKSSDYRQDDDEEEYVAAMFFLVMAVGAVWFIGSLYIGRSIHILDVLCGVGLLTAFLGVSASLGIRLQRLERRLLHRRTPEDPDPNPAFEFDDELFDPGNIRHRSAKIDQLLW